MPLAFPREVGLFLHLPASKTLSGAWTGLDGQKMPPALSIRANVPVPGAHVQKVPWRSHAAWTAAARCSVRGLLAVIAVGCDGRRAEAVRQQLGRRSLLAHAVQQVAEAGPDQVLASLPDPRLADLASACGVDSLVRPAGAVTLEAALLHALDHAGGKVSHLLALDPLLPLRRPGRLAQALALAVRDQADCVFSCHRESSLIWHRSAMGLIPCFDPAHPPDLGAEAEDLPWLREDGGFYLLDAATFRQTGNRHGGRLAPLETEPEEAVVAVGSSGLAVCRALLAEAARA
jgi:CMP-N-acetylneuraminic acid synthetase